MTTNLQNVLQRRPEPASQSGPARTFVNSAQSVVSKVALIGVLAAVIIAVIQTVAPLGTERAADSARNLLFATGTGGGPGIDTDAEGLADSIEVRYGSSAYVADTDGDGISDFFEAVFSTDPLNPGSFPTAEQLQVPRARVISYLEGDNFHLTVAVSVPNGNFESITNVGALLFLPALAGYSGPQLFDLNPLVLSGTLNTQNNPGGGSTTIYSSDSWFPKEVIHAFIAADGFAQFTIAFSASVGNTIVSDIEMYTTAAAFDASLITLASLTVSTQNPGSGAFKPLSPVALPPDWVANTACFVTSSMIGVEYGAILILEAISAECGPQNGTTCSPTACHSMNGRIFRVIDPCTLGVCQ